MDRAGGGRTPRGSGFPLRTRRPPRSTQGRARPEESTPSRARSTESSLPGDVTGDLRSTARRGRVPEATRLAAEALDALARDRLTEAARAAARLKEVAPRSAVSRELLGIVLYRQERFREAVRELQTYRRISGRLDQNHLIADCHRALGHPEKAVTAAQEALAADVPNEARAEAAVVGGAALADLGRFDEAIALLRRWRTRSSAVRPYDLRVWYVVGDVFERAGRAREAATWFRRVIEHDPGAFDAAERLAALS